MVPKGTSIGEKCTKLAVALASRELLCRESVRDRRRQIRSRRSCKVWLHASPSPEKKLVNLLILALSGGIFSRNLFVSVSKVAEPNR